MVSAIHEFGIKTGVEIKIDASNYHTTSTPKKRTA
jgi:hypothetical protein